ncbi:MAG: chitobiase/beta-hexosaminidase C-terminal domain-containing protein [Roseburia sp.]
MVGIWALFVLFIISCICAVVSLICAIIFEKKLGPITVGVLSLISAIFQWLSIDVPCPQIYPLNNEIPRSSYESIQIQSNDGLDVYYTLDGSDPKYGELYTHEIKLESTTTIAARAKFFFWWSDIEKSNYEVEQNTETSEGSFAYSSTNDATNSIPQGGTNSSTEANTSSVIEDDTKSNSKTITPIETHTPNDVAWSVSLLNWDVNCDYGINGNRYGGGIKVVISNSFSSWGSGLENQITSRIMIPLNDPNDKQLSGIIVLDQSMYGSASSATIRILANNEEVFSTGEIDGNTTSPFVFNVNAGNADSFIIETAAVLRGTSFIYGLVSPKDD